METTTENSFWKKRHKNEGQEQVSHLLFLVHPWFPECCWKSPWSECDLDVARRSRRQQVSEVFWFLAFRLSAPLILTQSETSVKQVPTSGASLFKQETTWPAHHHFLCSAAATPNTRHDSSVDFSLELVFSVSVAKLPVPPPSSLARCPLTSVWRLFRHFQAFNMVENISSSCQIWQWICKSYKHECVSSSRTFIIDSSAYFFSACFFAALDLDSAHSFSWCFIKALSLMASFFSLSTVTHWL